MLPCAYVPFPFSDTRCGLAPPLSPMISVAFRAPVVVGVKVTVKVQLAFPGSVDLQVLVWVKSLALPDMPNPVKVSGELPTLVRVKVMGWLVVPAFWSPKSRLEADSATTVPVPLSEIVCGLSPALSVMVTVPL